MLDELHVHNYAIIEKLQVRFTGGLNVLTGETGAGKSILIGALGLLLGDRTDTSIVRAGAEETAVSGVVGVGGSSEAAAWLAAHGIEPEEGAVILRRVLKATGRGASFIQSTPVTRADLAEFSSLLFDVHGQHEHQSLLDLEQHRRLLDRHGGTESARRALPRAVPLARLAARAPVEARERRARTPPADGPAVVRGAGDQGPRAEARGAGRAGEGARHPLAPREALHPARAGPRGDGRRGRRCARAAAGGPARHGGGARHRPRPLETGPPARGRLLRDRGLRRDGAAVPGARGVQPRAAGRGAGAPRGHPGRGAQVRRHDRRRARVPRGERAGARLHGELRGGEATAGRGDRPHGARARRRGPGAVPEAPCGRPGARRGHRGGASPPRHAEGRASAWPCSQPYAAAAAAGANAGTAAGAGDRRRSGRRGRRGAGRRGRRREPVGPRCRRVRHLAQPRRAVQAPALDRLGRRALARDAGDQGGARGLRPDEHADLRRGGRGHRGRGGPLGRGTPRPARGVQAGAVRDAPRHHRRAGRQSSQDRQGDVGRTHGDPRGTGRGRLPARGDRPDARGRPHGRAVAAARAGAARPARRIRRRSRRPATAGPEGYAMAEARPGPRRGKDGR